MLGLVFRYGGAVLAVAVAAGLRWLLHDVLGDTLAYITFHPLVALVAMLAGGGPGVLATVLSGVVVDVWIVAPDGHHDAAEVVGMGCFGASGLVMSTMGEMLRRARRREKAGLEEQVAARTDDLRRANASLQNEVEDRRRAEQSLRRSERRFRTVFEHAATGIAITTLDAKFEECNPAYCAILGYTEEELRQTPFPSLVYPEDREANLAELRRLRAGDVSFFEVENRYVHKSGRPVWVRKWVSLLPDEIGTPAHIIMALVTDMTERRRAEMELRQEHELSEAIINTAPVIVLLLGPDGRVLRFNSFMERLTGWTLAEARGRDWFDTFLPARDRERIRGLFDRALGNERTHANVNPIVTRAGVERDIEWYDAPVRGAGGELIGLLCIGNDISARKQAEEALRASERRWRDLAEALPQLVWTCTPDGRCDFLSPQWVDFTGQAEADQLGYGWLDQVHPDDRDRLRSVWGGSLAAGRILDIEFRIRRADGTYRWFKTRAVPVRGADGRVAKWFGSNTDIEDLKCATDELRASEERLHLMADALPALIAYVDADARYQFNNAAYERWFGQPTDAFKGRHMREVLGAAYDTLREHVEAALGGQRRTFETPFPYHGAGTRDVLIHYIPHRHQDGSVLGFFVLIIDLTDRKQAEEALRASEELQRAVLASLSSHIAVLGRDGRIVAVNPAWEEFARANGGDAGQCGVGTNYLAVCRAAAGEGAEGARRVADGLQALLDGTAGALSVEYPCPFGTTPRWFLLQATPLRTRGGGVVVSHMDITGRVRAEQDVRDREARLRAILDTAADAIITIDVGGVVQSVNPAAERMFGYAAAELTGRNVSLLMPPPHREAHDGYLARYRQTGEAHVIGIGREVEGRRKDGTVFPIELAVSDVPHLPLFTGILHDITRRKELERDVVEIASLEQRRIGQDLHDSVAQELTALNLLAGDLAETLRAGPADGAALAERISRGLQRGQHQLRAVLRGLLPVAVDAGGLMAALADLADRTGREGPAACAFDCPEPISVPDNVVATQVYLIAQEAVRNAVRHGRPRSVRITLESDHHLTLRVRDDGTGLPPQPTELQGLGLRIMRNRAAIVGAVLTIGPAEPTGTVVTCVLPRKWHEQQPER